MWVPAVDTPTVVRASELERAFGTEMSRRLRVERALRRAGGWAACFTVLFLAGWLVSRNMGLHPGAQFASIFPVDKVSEPVATPVDETPVMLILAAAPADEVIENVMPVPEKKPVFDPVNHRYCLVVASCTTKAEAESYVTRSTDLPLGIVESEGRWRVYAATGATVSDALAAGDVEPIASRYPSRWVCRR